MKGLPALLWLCWPTRVPVILVTPLELCRAAALALRHKVPFNNPLAPSKGLVAHGLERQVFLS